MKKFNKFAYVYTQLRKKHPDWSKSQLRYRTMYALRR